MKWFGPFSFDTFMNPWALLLLLGVLAVFAAEILARTPGTLNISTGETLARFRRPTADIKRRLPALLRAVGLSFLVLALARPITGYQIRKDRENIIDIMLCVDISGSMRSQDFISAGQRRDRLFVTKEAVRDFIDSRKAHSSDRYGLDRLGLVLYGKYAYTACPLTLDYGVLEHVLSRTEINPENEISQRTAIGSAIGLAVSRLRKSEAKSKVIILLTDGLNNAGELSPPTAARLAKDFGIKIYTIGAGSPEGGVVPTSTIFGPFYQQTTEGVDEDGLKKIAGICDGKYYRATDTDSLRQAYAEINQLETTDVELGDYYEHKEGFVPYAAAGAMLMLVSVFSRRQWFETIP
jgi:Ca-activated chloride channel family protein